MEFKEAKLDELRFLWSRCTPVSPSSWQLLACLNYTLLEDFSSEFGTWKVYVRNQPFLFSKLGNYKESFSLFFAIFTSFQDSRQFSVCGEYENIETLKTNLLFLSQFLCSSTKRSCFYIPTVLTMENSQDYGYIRGLIIGIFLMSADLAYSSLFKLRSGVLTTFLEYTKLVYAGTPGFAIVVGMAAVGSYFGALFIALPIAAGSFYRWKAKTLQAKLIERFPLELLEYDFGTNAEQRLEEQHDMIIENLRKEAMFQDIGGKWKSLSKQDFEEIYTTVKEIFLFPDSFLDLLERMIRSVPDFDLRKFLRTYLLYAKKKPEVVLRFFDSSSTSIK